MESQAIPMAMFITLLSIFVIMLGNDKHPSKDTSHKTPSSHVSRHPHPGGPQAPAYLTHKLKPSEVGGPSAN